MHYLDHHSPPVRESGAFGTGTNSSSSTTTTAKTTTASSSTITSASSSSNGINSCSTKTNSNIHSISAKKKPLHHGSNDGMDSAFKKRPLHHGSNDGMDSAFIWILVDGVGLALITACTLIDAIHSWKVNFRNDWLAFTSNSLLSEFLDSDLVCALLFWWGGRIMQVIGLMFLLSYAATFEHFPDLERYGM